MQGAESALRGETGGFFSALSMVFDPLEIPPDALPVGRIKLVDSR
ncbi:hypothetical protein SynBIOSE41_01224 [Synechococcus sp. BIOS-E4-1]|nr:hypothetical protein SynBIOSE41_01224 [Synechococcus sp. BIOS-E4-1]